MKKKKLTVKFNKIIIFILLIIFCVFSNSTASDKESDAIKNSLIKVCESKYEQGSSNLYYCILSQFYAFERVLDIMIKYKPSEDIKKLDNLLIKHHSKRYDVFDFIKVERDFNNYLKEKER